jgi:hypothetical protein
MNGPPLRSGPRTRKRLPVTAFQIFLVVALKGALLVFLRKKGWWPDWEARARQREEEKRVLIAYREWRKNARSTPAADPRIPL